MQLIFQSSPVDLGRGQLLPKNTSLLSCFISFVAGFFLKSVPSVLHIYMDLSLRLCFEPDLHALWLQSPCLRSFFPSRVFQIFINPLLCVSHCLLVIKHQEAAVSLLAFTLMISLEVCLGPEIFTLNFERIFDLYFIWSINFTIQQKE